MVRHDAVAVGSRRRPAAARNGATAFLSLAKALRKLLAPIPSFLLPKRQVLVVRSGAADAPSSAPRWSLSTGDWDVF